ncbi:hypothetical protein [Sphingomonas sp. CFBP 13706]|uniref:hypothetical protein n=1 Tax=Sphingomonas sp. CFBP 13706 TaxID=2775314 RepID=UPI0017857127|nr:hypothetical protein [Sphingomonas sp. CFBP 13706]MBD8736239.1 hypothetical protein [Sphingomonas sp. CFBP 13706]
MPSPDFSMVEPERRPEVARRIQVIESFLKSPGRRSAAAHAAQLGLKISHFYRLVRIWSERKQPQEMAKATRRRSGYRHAKGLDDAQLALVRGTEAGMPDDAVLEHVLKRIYGHAEAMGIAFPSRPTVRAAAAAARRQRLAGRPAGVGLVIDHCAVRMAVDWKGTSVAPIATLVLDLERRMVVGAALSTSMGNARSTCLAMIDALGRVAADQDVFPASARLPIEMDIDEAADWQDLIAALERHGVQRTGSDLPRLPGGRRTVALLGKDVNGIGFMARTTHRPPETRCGIGDVVDLEEAQDYVRAKLIGPQDDAALSRIPKTSRDALRQELRTLAGG